MTSVKLLESSDLDVPMRLPVGLLRLVEQGVVDLAPWHIMPRELARKRMDGLRQRYTKKYVPFARRQDNDDLACLDPEHQDQIVVIHDFASEGFEMRRSYESFWDWFRSAIEDMILFE